ncbi:MAG: hypothetical protein ACP6IU_05765 [Candidatus Asgardarchaeia archaeon]
MPRVLMTFFGHFRTVIGMTSEYVDTETLYDAIIKIANKHGDKVKQLLMYDDGRLKSNYVISIQWGLSCNIKCKKHRSKRRGLYKCISTCRWRIGQIKSLKRKNEGKCC